MSRRTLKEDVVRSSKLRVDREAGVIRHVKILGFESANGRRYLPEAVKRAQPEYEGRSVRCDHPRKPEDSREVDDVFGWLRDTTLEEDGLYGDLHYLKSHPMAQRVCEAAERNPGLFGLSHNAQGDGETINGVFVVREIVEVRSVDLVADPATTRGLFESRERKRMKLKAWMEAIKLPKPKRTKKLLARLFEAGYMDQDMEATDDMGEPPPEDASPADHKAALRGGFEASCMACIQDALDGKADPTEALKRLKELLTAHGKLAGSGEDVEEDDEDLEEDDDEDLEEDEDEDLEEEECDDKDKKMKESLRRLKRKDKARDLCEQVGVKPSKTLLLALCRLRTDKARRALLEETGSRRKPAPRSGSGGSGGSGKNPAVLDLGDFISAARA
jgi:hypothetical protein